MQTKMMMMTRWALSKNDCIVHVRVKKNKKEPLLFKKKGPLKGQMAQDSNPT